MRVVLLDVDGVLVHGYHTRPEKRRRWDERMEADLGIRPEDFKARFIDGVFVSAVLTGQRSLISALDNVLPTLGFTGSSMAFVSYWLERDSQVNQPLLALVRALRRTGAARLCVATNQEHLRAFHLWNTLGSRDLFDDMFHSARLGALKPDRRFFARIAALIGPQSEPPLMFDDSPAVVAAASEFGWEGVLFEDLPDCGDHPWVEEQLARA
jgi:putative hydrolase of the HAD superfamily